MSSVTSRPVAQTYADPQPQRGRKFDPGVFIGALVGVLIGVLAWIFGAKYTVDGIVLIANSVLEFITAPQRIVMRWDLYLWLLPFPLAFSAVEWTCSPFGKSRTKHPGLITVWCVVVAADMGSTVIGLAAAKSPTLVVAIVSTTVGVAILTTLLTFGPESLLKSCTRLLWRAIRALFA